MKFAYKLTLAITALLAVFISLGGTLLVRRAFQSGLDAAVRQSTGAHLLEKYAFEADLLDIAGREQQPTDDHLRRYADSITGYFGSDERLFALYSDRLDTVFSNLPQGLSATDLQDALNAGGEGCILRQARGRTWLLMASRIDTPARGLWLLSAFEVSEVFAERDAQLRYLWQMEAVLLGLAVLVVAVLSMLLTRPIKKLSRASHSIAGGAYGRRTGVKTGDEIGDLARDFDAMAAAVEDRVAELNLSIRQRDDFVAAFTHEIKTPMTSLIGYSNILRRTEEEPQVRQMAAGHIYHEARRLEALSQKLLELMGLAEGLVELAPVRAGELFTDAARSLEGTTEEVRLVCEGDADAVVLADRVLAADLLRNLMSNAMRARPQDNQVRVHFRRGRSCCRVLVCDAGCGIPAGELARITEPFYMVDKSRARKQGGSGIGLSLASRIAELHRSEIHSSENSDNIMRYSAMRFRSTPGVGTVVAFSLPLPPTAEEVAP